MQVNCTVSIAHLCVMCKAGARKGAAGPARAFITRGRKAPPSVVLSYSRASSRFLDTPWQWVYTGVRPMGARERKRDAVRDTTRGARRRGGASRTPWSSSRGRLMFNMILSGIATVFGLILVIAPRLLGATSDSRTLGGVLAGYGVVRGYYFYRRWRSHAANQPPAGNQPGARRRRG